MYDYLIVGAGLTGAVCARELTKLGKKVMVIDKRNHIAGNCYTESLGGINVYKYGPHIFHTNNKKIWDYVNQFDDFNGYVHKVKVKYRGEIYTLPINLSTFSEFFGGDITPENMRETFDLFTSSARNKDSADNLESYILTKIPKSMYDALIKGYTEKHWGKSAKELPSSIIKRVPIRYTFDDRYWDDDYQGIPKRGYTYIVDRMLDGVEVILNQDFMSDRSYYLNLADKIIYTGCIDEFFNYDLGKLDYRSIRFVEERLDTDNFQGIAQMNYTERDVPYTRIIEHKHFTPNNKTSYTIITYEYPDDFNKTNEPYYPIRDDANTKLYNGYASLAKKYFPNLVFCGRLGSYQYYDMHQVIAQALQIVEQEKNENS